MLPAWQRSISAICLRGQLEDAVIIADIFSRNLPDCEWMSSMKTVEHEYSDLMKRKSETAQLATIDANEAKHEDCLKIMDKYEEILTELFVEAHGSDDLLREYKAIVGGDQLTRCRLQESKSLMSLSPKKRFDDVEAIVIEMWHVKQDLLEKLYTCLYNTDTIRTTGSLAYFKASLQRTDVSGKVKGHFKSHMQFLCLIGEKVVAEQAKEFCK